MNHNVKSWTHLFEQTLSGAKLHDLRVHDRPYTVGDSICLQEFDPETQTYTGREQSLTITAITSASNPCALSLTGLVPGFCILTIQKGKQV